jgi:colanic acid/amylovoran biosynthesis glycosyltransferase
VNIAYLVNRYPAASHSFIRREIEALESHGASVTRISVRAVDAQDLPDPRDREERTKTQILISRGWARLAIGLATVMLSRPLRSLAALRVAVAHMSWRPKEFLRRIAYLAEAAALLKILEEGRVVHLHAHFGTNPAMVARLVWKLGGPPYSFTVHGPDEFDAPKSLDLAGKIADSAFCVAISSFGSSQLMRWSAYENWHKIRIVRCGVDERFIDNPSLSSAPDASNLCAVARLSPQKGIPLLIDACSRLRSAGRFFQLTLVGDGEMRPEIERLISENGLDDCVRITGWANSEDVARHIQAARAMVLPSFAEGLPVVIMEALALQRPVIVSAIAGTPELVDSHCGWLIPAGSIEALVDAMENALDAPVDRLDTMGEVGLKRVKELHDARQNGLQLLKLIELYHSGQS